MFDDRGMWSIFLCEYPTDVLHLTSDSDLCLQTEVCFVENKTNWYLCPSAHDNVVMYITKFNIAITMIISMFEDRGMWVDIFMFAMCQHLYVYNNSCFHMFLDIIRVFKSVSG